MSDTQQQKSMSTPATVLAPKQQYINLMSDGFAKFGEIVAAANVDPGTKRANVAMHIKIMINYIPNPKERVRLKNMRKESIETFIKRNGKDSTTLSEYTFELDTDIMGEIMELYDDVLGINERQQVMSTTPISKLEQKYYPEGYFIDQTEELNEDITEESGEE